MSTDQDAFRLTDVEGDGAPKSRSWRSGFLRKRSAPVALVSTSDVHDLKSDVGKRVAATGPLSGRTLTLTTLRVVGSSCE